MNTVWIALAQDPESNSVSVGASEESVLRQLCDFMDESVGSDSSGDGTYLERLVAWSGDKEIISEEGQPGVDGPAYYIGEDWRVFEAKVVE